MAGGCCMVRVRGCDARSAEKLRQGGEGRGRRRKTVGGAAAPSRWRQTGLGWRRAGGGRGAAGGGRSRSQAGVKLAAGGDGPTGEQKDGAADEAPEDAGGPDEDGEEQGELAGGVVGEEAEEGEHGE